MTYYNPDKVLRPNMDCAARGKVGAGNIGIHSQKERRSICHVWARRFPRLKGRPSTGEEAKELVMLVVTLLANGCPIQAIAVAFGLVERTVRDWLKRPGTHCQAAHEHLVEQLRELARMQADEIRVSQTRHLVGG
ncbi:MAG: hypothetical protein QW376_08465 [Candidatus Caldarchaeum sp.]